MKQRIAFIGMGVMGCPMAHNLLKAGFSVIVHSRTPAKAQPVLTAGAAWASTPAQAAASADVVITCVTDTPDVQAVLLGKDGVIESARTGTICVDMSTICPDATRRMAATLAEKGITLLDAPVSGGQIGAIEAKLSIMVGGDEKSLQTVRPVLEAMGRTLTHCGPVGTGQTTKLANQVMVIHTLMSMAEGLAFAEKAGLDLHKTHAVTCGGAAYSHSLKVLGEKVLNGDMAPAFAVDLQLKDLRLVMDVARRIGQPLPGAALVMQLLESLSAKGRGKDGTQSLIDVLRGLAKG